MLSVDKMTLLLVFVQLQAFYLCTRDLMINMFADCSVHKRPNTDIGIGIQYMLAYIGKEKGLAAFEKITNIYFRKKCSDPVAVTALRQGCVVLDTVFVCFFSFFSSFFFLYCENQKFQKI